jgi:hypothetical protein
LNGMPVVQFVGTNNLSLPSFLSAATQAEAFVVLNVANNATNAQSLWVFSDYASFENSEQYGIGGIQENFGSTSYYNLGLPAQPLNQYHVFEVSAQTNNWAAWINGALQYQTFINTVQFCPASDATYLGAFNYNPGNGFHPKNFFNGNVAELLVFNRALTGDERITIGTYLTSKYKLSLDAVSASAPATPTNFLATGVAPEKLNLSWVYQSTNQTISVLERKLGVGSFQEIANVAGSVSNFVDTTAIPTNQYFYRVRAENYFGNSTNSTQISPPTINLTNCPTVVFETETDTIIGASTDAFGAVSNVMFYAQLGGNNPLIGMDNTSPYSVVWTPTMSEPYGITALASDSLGNSQFSLPTAVTAYLDANGDSIPDIWEVQNGNNPLNPWIAPGVNTNDHTAPVITLLVPTNAVIVP